MDENVSKAVARADQYCGTYEHGFAVKNTWDVIRARLLSQDAEIDELVRALTMCADRAKRAESHLAAADALLRKCRDEFARLPHSLGYDFTHLPEIDAHLSENGHG